MDWFLYNRDLKELMKELVNIHMLEPYFLDQQQLCRLYHTQDIWNSPNETGTARQHDRWLPREELVWEFLAWW